MKIFLKKMNNKEKTINKILTNNENIERERERERERVRERERERERDS
jgi:hypothetical protein